MQAMHRWVVVTSGKAGHDAGRTVMNQSRMTARRPAATVLLIAMLFHQFAFALNVQSGKVIIAIVDFKNTGASGELDYLTQTIPESISTSMAKSGRLEIVERSRLEEALNEMQMSEVGIVDESLAVELGRAVGANAILVGSFVSIGGILRINSRLIDVMTSRVIKAEIVQGAVGTEIFNMMDEMAASIESQLLGTVPEPVAMDTPPQPVDRQQPQPEPVTIVRELVTPSVAPQRSGGGGFAVLLLLAAAGGAAYYYFVVLAPVEVAVNVSIEP